MIDTFVKDFTNIAHKQDINNLEFYTQTMMKSRLSVYEGSLDSYDLSEVSSCYIEGDYEGYRGYIYVENFSEELFKENICKLKEVAIQLKEPFKAKNIRNYVGEEKHFTPNKDILLDKLLKAEKVALAYDERVNKILRLIVEEVSESIIISNDKGDKIQESIGYVNFNIEVSAKENTTIQTGEKFVAQRIMENIDFEQIALEASKEAVDLLGSSPIKTGKYSVIVQNNVVCELLSTYLATFAGDSVRKKLTKFGEMQGEKIASQVLNLQENPFFEQGIKQRKFDDEGNETSSKSIIKSGILENFIYNEDEANKAGKSSTGNGFKSSYKSKAGINITNLQLIGDKNIDELLEQMNEGLYITTCDGMFAGADPVSGNFSLISKGYMVENGKKTKGISQITIAGNFYDMLSNIRGVATDYLQVGDGKGAYIAPSIWIEELVISGL